MSVIEGGVVLAGGTLNGTGRNTPFPHSGEPDSGGSGSYVGLAVEGSILIDTATGDRYVATDATTGETVSWVLVDTVEPA